MDGRIKKAEDWLKDRGGYDGYSEKDVADIISALVERVRGLEAAGAYVRADGARKEIDRLKGELEEANTIANDNYDIILSLRSSVEKFESQLSEARAEIERISLENRQMLQGMKWDNQLKAEARQQAAREIIEMMGGWSLQNSTLITCRGIVARHFGLEG